MFGNTSKVWPNRARKTLTSLSSLEGYLTARILVEGLRRAGKNLSRDGLINGLESMHDFNLGGFTVNYSARNHQASNFTELTIIGRGGKFMR